MKTWTNWIFVFKNKFANKYRFPAFENKLHVEKKTQLKKCRKQPMLATSTSDIFNQDAFSELLFQSLLKIIKEA